MKIPFPLLLLSFVAPPALACGSESDILDRGGVCSEAVIRYPDGGVFFDGPRNCCVFGDPWIAANNMSGCCNCRTGPGKSPDLIGHNR